MSAMDAKDNKLFSILLDKGTRDRIAILAKKYGLTKADVIRAALEILFEHEGIDGELTEVER
jgi:predicted DNA-binding protein